MITQEKHKIDINDISIDVSKGETTNVSNKRCKDVKSEDGFVYTVSTIKEGDDYYYNDYSADTQRQQRVGGADSSADSLGKNIEVARVAEINSINTSNGRNMPLNGMATPSKDFIANEGNKSYDELKSAEYEPGEYDKNTIIYSDQLIKVRNLK